MFYSSVSTEHPTDPSINVSYRTDYRRMITEATFRLGKLVSCLWFSQYLETRVPRTTPGSSFPFFSIIALKTFIQKHLQILTNFVSIFWYCPEIWESFNMKLNTATMNLDGSLWWCFQVSDLAWTLCEHLWDPSSFQLCASFFPWLSIFQKNLVTKHFFCLSFLPYYNIVFHVLRLLYFALYHTFMHCYNKYYSIVWFHSFRCVLD